MHKDDLESRIDTRKQRLAQQVSGFRVPIGLREAQQSVVSQNYNVSAFRARDLVLLNALFSFALT